MLRLKMSLLLLCWGRSSFLARFCLFFFFAGDVEMGIPSFTVYFFAFSICLFLLHDIDVCFRSVAYSLLDYMLCKRG